MTFKEGGAFDFHSTFERIKERLQQAVEVAHESGHLVGDGAEIGHRHALVGVNLDAVHLDELPTYDAANASGNPVSILDTPVPHFSTAQSPRMAPPVGPLQDRNSPPSEPPPYEDVQRSSVSDELERRLRRD
jgi:hypothetical protein